VLVEDRSLPFLLADPKLPSLEAAWDRRDRLVLFNEEVLPVVLARRLAMTTAIEDMTYSPARACVVLYAVRLEGETVARLAVATFAKDDRLSGVFVRNYAGRPGAAVLLPRRRCLVELFPADWKLPRLAPAVEPAGAAALLDRLPAPARGDRGQPDVTLLRYRPHQRCVLLYACQGAEAIAKVYQHRERAAITWAVMRELHARAPSLGLVVPTPLAFVRSGNLVLMTRVAGSSLKQAIRETPNASRATELAECAASSLVALHGLRVVGGEERSFAEELAQLRRRAARFQTVAPVLGAEVDDVLARLTALAPQLAWRGRSFVHGDFKPSQLLLDGDRLALVDFDRAARGDPALDVGNFMAQFRKEAVRGGPEHLRPVAARFLAAYDALSPRRPVAQRALAFEALALARMAVRSFRRSPYLYARTGPDSLPSLLLEEARSCLERL
jgi:aminoglycoside phosphotransferase (APT) family kinase protein